MFNVYLYNFSKKYNSTKTPDEDTPFINASCELKEGTSIINPTLILRMSGNPSVYNYCRIAEFRRRYFVENWRWAFGNWECDLKVDVLGSYAAEIGNSTQYVTRAAYRINGSKAYNGNIADSIYPILENSTVFNDTWEIWPEGYHLASGRYVVGLYNNDFNGTTPASLYSFTPAAYAQLKGSLMTSTEYMQIEDLGEGLQKALVNPLQYIAFVTWYPFTLVSEGSASPTENIKCGWWQVPTLANSVYRMGGVMTKQITHTFTVRKHPYASNRGEYLNTAPFSKYWIVADPWGTIPIDSSLIKDATTITATIMFDFTSGNAVLSLDTSYCNIIRMTARAGTPMPVGQITQDIAGGASAIAGGIGGAMSNAMRGDIGGVIASAASGIKSSIEAVTPKTAVTGTPGSLCSYFDKNLVIFSQFYDVAPEGLEHLGRPLCEYTRINTLSGFIMCADSEIDLTATDAEKREIQTFMDSGFFYEV